MSRARDGAVSSLANERRIRSDPGLPQAGAARPVAILFSSSPRRRVQTAQDAGHISGVQQGQGRLTPREDAAGGTTCIGLKSPFF